MTSQFKNIKTSNFKPSEGSNENGDFEEKILTQLFPNIENSNLDKSDENENKKLCRNATFEQNKGIGSNRTSTYSLNNVD